MQEIFNKYGDIKTYTKELTKPLPEHINKVTSEEGVGQYLVESNQENFVDYLGKKNLDNESQICNYSEQSTSELMNKTRYLWENLRISEEKNFPTLLSKMFEDLNSLKEYIKSI